jgi:hypothetical protein
MEADVRLNFELWKAARDISTSCDDRMKETGVHTACAPSVMSKR